MKRIYLVSFLSVLVASQLGFAKSGPSPVPANFKPFGGYDTSKDFAEHMHLTTQKELDEVIADGNKNSVRQVASGGGVDYSSKIVGRYKAFIDAILAADTADKLDGLLEQLNRDYEAYDNEIANHKAPYWENDFAYFAAQVLPMRCMKGVVYKFRPIAEEKSKLIHSRLLSSMMSIANNISVMLPTKEWKAGFDYVTLPYPGMVQWGEGFDLQKHLVDSCVPELRKSIDRISRIDLHQPVVFDSRLFYGTTLNPNISADGVFPDKLDRYKLVGEAERHMTLALKNLGISWILYLRQYDFYTLFETISKVGKLYGIDAYLPEPRDEKGVTLEKRVHEIRTSSDRLFKNYAFYEPRGPKRDQDRSFFTKGSLAYLHEGVSELRKCWAWLEKAPNRDQQIMNPGFFKGFDRSITANLDKWWAMVNGPTQMDDRITGEVADVNLPEFYNNPPDDLRDLLPRDFKHGELNVPMSKDMNISISRWGKITPVQRRDYHDYHVGDARSWDSSLYSHYITNLKGPEDVGNKVRIISQSWGGSFLKLPLLRVIE